MINKILLTGLIVFCSFFIKAQKEDNRDLNCYNKWSIKFDERGAEEVLDGVYTDVIITSRVGATAKCYSGKAEVINNKLTKFFVKLEDGTYDEVKRSWKDKSNTDVYIINGISKTMITIHSELINVLWPKKIKPKKPAMILAPEPKDE
ncbi:MAG: hypothetical protein ACK504_12535 [Bacteroidota bacterium]